MFVDLVLPLNITNVLTYSVPVELQTQIQPGLRVEVNLGTNKVYAGLVIEVHDIKPSGFRIRPINAIIDKSPIIQTWQIDFWKWVAEYYMESLGSIMNAALPAHLKLMNESYLVWTDKIDDIPEEFPEVLKDLALALMQKKKITFSEIKEIVPIDIMATAIDDLLQFELAYVSDALEEKYKPKEIDVVALHPNFHSPKASQELFEQLKNAPRQSDILMVYLAHQTKFGQMQIKELLEKSKSSRAPLNQLIDKNIFVKEKEQVDRIRLAEYQEKEDLVLTPAQEVAYQQIKTGFKEDKTILLHGVTGSGKTVIYMQLIKEALDQGKQALFMLPEIAITTQIVQRLQSYFGDIVGVYHSRFSNNERIELWNKVKSGKCQLIVGARSSLWLPYKDLGLIIVDEEHDASLKQADPSPRFQARDSALYLAHLLKSKVLLGSATPSLESMYNAETGKYKLVQLKERYQGVPLPSVEIVAANHINPALSNYLTVPLLQAIEERLKNGKQVILFQNKRGYIPLVVCTQCQTVAQCEYCDVSLTYHKHSDKMHCHYCGHTQPLIKACKNCGSHKLSARNFGTERVEEDLARIFPKHRVGRIDADITRSKQRQQKVLQSFEQGAIDVLVGTQMIVKGFDFPNVDLVGVLNADSLWSFPEFRVQERAFQLLSQVAGRAGRLKDQGTVLIQTFNRNHPILKHVIGHDYMTFYKEEMLARKMFHYPPYFKMIRITVRDRNEEKCQKGATWLAHFLRENKEYVVQGPSEGLLRKLRNQYVQELVIKSSVQTSFLANNKKLIAKAIDKTRAKRGFSNLQIIVNVDPN